MKSKKRSTSWTAETAPRSRQGRRARKTLIREAIGRASWNRLQTFLQEEGAEKMVEALRILQGRDFIVAYIRLLEFIRPKLTRTTHVGDPQNALELKSGIDISKLTPEQQVALYNAME